jgi:hypothetical protein
MANNQIQVKRTSTAGRTPNTTGSYATNSQYISAGEFALNMTDQILYTSDGTNLITVGANIVNQRVTGTLTTNVISINNGQGLRFQTVNTSAYATLTAQNDDNFVFYTTNASYGARAVWSIYSNSSTSAFGFGVPVNFGANVGTLTANGSVGTAGQYLTSNGSTVYWSSPGATGVNTAAQYTWSNTQTFTGNVSMTYATFANTNGQANATGGNFIANAYAILGGGGGNYLAFGQQTNYAQWIQSGYSASGAVYYNIILNPLGGSVGIGNTAPGDRLSVNGTTYLGGNVTILSTAALNANGSVGTAGQLLTSNGSAIYWSSPGAASVNTAAQYTWTNTQTFSSNITFSGNGITLTTNTGAVYFNGLTDSNWKMGRNAGTFTNKSYYTGNTLDIAAYSVSSTLEGFAIGLNGANAYLETGYNGTYSKNPIYIGNTSVNSFINSTALSVVSNTTINSLITGSSISLSNTASGFAFVANQSGVYTTGTVNTYFLTVGANFIANTSGVYTTGVTNAGSFSTTGTANVGVLNVSGNAAITGNLSLANTYINNTISAGFNTAGLTAGAQPAGTVYWNSAQGGLEVQLDSSTSGTVGQDEFYYVKASAAITKGQLIAFSGTVGSSGVATAAPANTALVIDPTYIMGIAAETISSGSFGYIQMLGTLKGFDTTGSAYGETWTSGSILYYNPNYSGGLTANTALIVSPTPLVQVAAVINAGSGGSGSVLIRVQTRGKIRNLGDVKITSVANGDLLYYNSANSLWLNLNQSALNVNSALNANNTSYVGSVTAANVVSNAQLSANLANYAALSGAAFTGNVSVGGNLVVTGTLSIAGNTEYVNATVITTSDLNMVLANGISTSALANGSGLVIGTYANLVYSSSASGWQSNVNFVPSTNNLSLGNTTSLWNVYGNNITGTNLYGVIQTTNQPLITANNTSYVGSVTAANVVSNAQLSANLANYALLSGGLFTGSVNATALSVGTTFVANATAITGAGYAQVANGLYSIGAFNGTYTDGIVVDYVGGLGRISVGTGDQLTFYTGNVATTAMATMNTTGTYITGVINAASHTVGTSFIANATQLTLASTVGLSANGSLGTSGQVLTSNGTTVYWSTVSGGGGFTNGQSISVNNFVVTGAITANSSNGNAGQVLTSNGTATYWSTVASGNGSNYVAVRQEYTANGSQNTFTVTGGYSANNLDVFLNGVKLYNGLEVNVASGSTFTIIGTNPVNGSLIEVVGSNGNSGLSTPSTIVNQQITANGTANSFAVTGGYIPGAVQVFLNGVKQIPSVDVITTSGANVNFVVTPANGYIIDIYGSQAATVSVVGGATGGGTDQVFFVSSQKATASYTIPVGKSAMMAGPLTLANGVVITVSSGSRLVVL